MKPVIKLGITPAIISSSARKNWREIAKIKLNILEKYTKAYLMLFLQYIKGFVHHPVPEDCLSLLFP